MSLAVLATGLRGFPAHPAAEAFRGQEPGLAANLLCRLGRHRWYLTKPLDGEPPYSECARCGKRVRGVRLGWDQIFGGGGST